MQIRESGEGDSFLPRSRPPQSRSPRPRAAAARAQCPPTRPASLWGRIWWLPRQARVGWPSSTFVSREQAPGARHRPSLSPVATACRPRELSRATGGPPPPLRPPANYLENNYLGSILGV
uniref:Uncharacterized protein n=1 Tax=Setaria italica TaxID=4555 RepID=K3YWT4_SETIT